ncbi:MAG: glycosyltransferase [Acidobacteriota bacterium]
MRILLVVPRYPWPARQGDRLRAGQLVELLGAEHEIRVLCPPPESGAPSPPESWPATLLPYSRSSWWRRGLRALMAGLRGEPLQAGWFREPSLTRRLREERGKADLVILQLARLAHHRQDLGEVPVVVDLIDCLALNFQQRARRESPPLSWVLREESRRLLKAESELVAGCRGALLVSGRDRDYLLEHSGLLERSDAGKAAADALRVLPLAFPLVGPSDSVVGGGGGAPAASGASSREGSGQASVESSASLEKAGGEQEALEPSASPYLVLTGNLGYFPTVDGALWFLDEVWSRLLLELGESPPRLVFAGARPAAALRQRIEECRRRGEAVMLVPSPPRLEPWLAAATVALAPMHSGSGQPIKILEAWQQGVPVVATAYAAAGTTGRPGEDLLVADDADSMVEAIAGLLLDPQRRAAIAASGRRRLELDYSRAAIHESWTKWLDGLGQAPVDSTVSGAELPER